MGCFLETAKERIQFENKINNNNNNNNNQHQIPTTTAIAITDCVDSIISKNKDNNKDNKIQQQQQTNATQANKQARKRKQQIVIEETPEEEEEEKEEEEKCDITTKIVRRTAATAIVTNNQQQLVKELLKLQQGKQQQQTLFPKNSITTVINSKAIEQAKEEQATILDSSSNIIDNEKNLQENNIATTIPTYCLLTRTQRRTQQQQQPHSNSKSNCCQSIKSNNNSSSCWRKTLHTQRLKHEQHYTTTSTATATSVARYIATAMAAACCSNGNNLPEMLLCARDFLATQLTQASNTLLDNLNNYAAATTTLTTTNNTTTATNNAFMLRKRQQQRRSCCQRQQQQQHQQADSTCQQRQQQCNNEHCDDDHSNNNNSCSAYSGYSHHSNNNFSNFSYSNNNNFYYNTLRNSISFYAASSVILVLCYLTTTTSAAATNSQNSAPLDKHPIQGIDWSKFDESSSDKEILDLLLEKKRYDKRLLPPVNDEDFCCGLSSPDMAKDRSTSRSHNRGTLTVNVNVLLLSLASPDESSLKYEVEFLLNQQWNDPRLQYGNKSQYDFLNALHHHDSIWTPDTYFIMHGDFKDPIIPMHFALRIYRNGTITYAMRRHLILSCQGSLHIFPFDDPKCSFSMESISYEEAQIKYVWKNDEDTLRKSPSLTTLNAYLIKNQTTACDQNSWRGNYSCLRVDLIFTRDRAFYFTTVFIPGIILVTSSFITFWLEWNAVPARSMIGNYSCLQVELTFTRDRAYYFTTVFIPGIILVTSSFITFWLEWNAVPARVMIGVTTMLNFFTTSNGFRSTLPVVSNLTAMNVWDGVCMCFIYASLLEFVCVNYVGRKRPLHNVVYRPGENPVTQRLPAVLSRIGVILASPLEIIEREFHAALSSEKAAAGISSTGTSIRTTAAMTPAMSMSTTPRRMVMESMAQEQQHGSIIGAAVQNLRARSIKYRKPTQQQSTTTREEAQSKGEQPSPSPPSPPPPTINEPIYVEPIFAATATATTVTLEDDDDDNQDNNKLPSGPYMRTTRSMSTNTPALVLRENAELKTKVVDVDIHSEFLGAAAAAASAMEGQTMYDIETAERQLPVKPPRKKTSRSTSPVGVYFMEIVGGGDGAAERAEGETRGRRVVGDDAANVASGSNTTNGEKRREAGAPNEIVACTSCGGSNSPCTHSANNGCATETCFVQVRKKEPPHPIRVAKTIDVIARITFPTAYSIFLIFFFVHYKGFS